MFSTYVGEGLFDFVGVGEIFVDPVSLGGADFDVIPKHYRLCHKGLRRNVLQNNKGHVNKYDKFVLRKKTKKDT